MSHPNPKKPVEPLQHIGFYMSSTKTPLLSSEIPAFFRLEETGTGVFIMGFNPRSDDWTRDVQMAVLENFFDAIHRKRLQVRVSSPDASDPIEITHETIDHLFNISGGARAPDAYHYYLATRDEESSTTPEIAQMGSLNVHVRTGSGPRRTAYINRNGMLITASREQNVNPLSPRGKSLWPDYAAVVTPSTDAGDAWIRAMENPSHDSVSPGQLTDLSLATVAEHALRDARRAIREIIDHKSEVEKYGDTSNLDELANVFPDFNPSLEGNRNLQVRQIDHRISPSSANTSQEGDSATTESDQDQERGAPSERKGEPKDPTDEPTDVQVEGEDTDLKSKRREEAPVRRARLASPRVIHTGDREVILAFTSLRDQPDGVSIALTPAGEEREDEDHIEIESVTSINAHDAPIEVDDGLITMKLHANQRILLRATTRAPVPNFALRLG